MQEPCITLQVIPQAYIIVDDLLQVIYAGAVIAAAEVEAGNFIVQHHHAMRVDEQGVFFQFGFDFIYQRKSFPEGACKKMMINLSLRYIEKRLYPEVVILL